MNLTIKFTRNIKLTGECTHNVKLTIKCIDYILLNLTASGTNRNESLHAFMNGCWPKTCGDELAQAMVDTIVLKLNMRRDNHPGEHFFGISPDSFIMSSLDAATSVAPTVGRLTLSFGQGECDRITLQSGLVLEHAGDAEPLVNRSTHSQVLNLRMLRDQHGKCGKKAHRRYLTPQMSFNN